jgi:hypothetical protein
MHVIGKALVELIYTRAGMKAPESFSLAVEKPQGHIDILCVVNKETAIVIEDKAGTKQHSGQLDKYMVHVTTELGYAPNNMILVYIQMGDQSDYGPVIECGYLCISRVELLIILESETAQTAKEQSETLRDFSAYLRKIEDGVQSYRATPPAEWTWEAWKGFYSRLQNELGEGHWDYVANPSGGFLGYWWHFGGNDDFDGYIQLEQEKLCFRIRLKDPAISGERRPHWVDLMLQHYWHDRIMAACKVRGLPVIRPSRIVLEKSMTVAVLTHDYRITGDGGLIDIDKTLMLLQSAQAVTDDCVKDTNLARHGAACTV